MSASSPIPIPAAPASAVETPAAPALLLQGFSYDERRKVLPAVARALENCGCFLLERRAVSLTQMNVRFEMQLRASLELYSSLIGAGLELTRASHLALTGLCTVRKHNRRGASSRRVVEVRLELSFLEEIDLASALVPGAARA
jgi:hypothetical protein